MRQAIVVTLILIVGGTARAQRVMHRVRYGETLAAISQHYYGTRIYAHLLQLANGLSHSEQVKAGNHIRVPTAWIHTVRRTTTPQALATRFLGDPRRWPALMMVNRVRGRAGRIKAGTRLVVPFILPYTVAQDESFEDLSTRFYGAKKHAGLIAAYNFITAPRPSPGTRIEIPLAQPRLDPLRLEDLTNDRLLGLASATTSEQRGALQEANALLRRGEYWAVPLRLLQLLAQDHPSDSHIAEVLKLLAIAYVALDQHDLAVRTFREALLRQPGMSMDVVSTSPKVFRALVDAKSALQRGGP